MYYTEHGLPIDADNTWSYANRYKLGAESSQLYEDVIPLNTTVVNLHLRREPRFLRSYCWGPDVLATRDEYSVG